jgi:hypothetical protein
MLLRSLRCHDIHTKFHKDRFRHSEAVKGGDTCTYKYTHTDSKEISYAYVSVFKIRKVG